MRQSLPFLGIFACVLACAPSSSSPAASPVTAETPASLPNRMTPNSVPTNVGYASLAGMMESPATSFGATTLGNHVYILGGYTGNPHEYSREFQSDTFARLAVDTNQWQSLPTPGPSQSATLNVYDGRILRIGGMLINNATGESPNLESVADVAFFDPVSMRWTPNTPLPEARSSHATVIVDDKIYVLGGWTMSGGMGSGKWADSVLVADLSQPSLQWGRLPVPFKSRALGAASVGQYVFAVGGMEGRKVQRAVHILDTHTGTWTEGPELPEPGFGISVVANEGSLFASTASGAIYALNSTTNQWDTHAQLIFPRFFHAMVSAGDDRLLVLGGIPSSHGGDRIRHIERITSDRTRFTTWLLDNPSGAKNRQGIFQSGNRLVTFGGNKALGQHDFAPDNFLQTTYELDLGSFAWTASKPFPQTAQSMQTLITGDGVGVSVGGFGPQAEALKARADVYHYDAQQDTWTAVTPLPEARTQFGLVEHGSKLWIFGGMTFDDTKRGEAMFSYPMAVLQRTTASTESFAESGIELPRARRAFAGALLGDRYYMFGGMAQGFAPVLECEAFDFTQTTWLTVACPSRTRIGAEMVALDGKLYLIAGRSKPAPERDLGDDPRVEVYDPATDTWSLLVDELPIDDTHQLRAFPFGHQILLYTGQRTDTQIQLTLFDPHAP